ncbi:hypothetical protein M569_10161 [Genlisea aurea]|uniref:GATA-type domain-containing protein n=1 Tax=Genlisea aurea TaxID=192259 RepID=S8CCD2_9LAMI|nr:hypothetical protein M569_10161 [Genlisea aurea]
MDLSDKGSECEEMCGPDSRVLSDGTNIKTCVDCGTSKTPLWRGGPAGPKSLCNACGIRSRKKRRALMGVTKEDKKPKKSSHHSSSHSSTTTTTTTTSSSGGGNSSSKIWDHHLKNGRSWPFGRDVALQRPRSNTNRRRKLGEEEQAAVLLMALSCGSVYA